MERGGQPGNQNAAKGKRWQKALERALARRYGDVDTGLEKLAEKFIALSETDEAKDVCRDIADRFDGKPAQALEHSGPGGELPVAVSVVLTPALPKPED